MTTTSNHLPAKSRLSIAVLALLGFALAVVGAALVMVLCVREGASLPFVLAPLMLVYLAGQVARDVAAVALSGRVIGERAESGWRLDTER